MAMTIEQLMNKVGAPNTIALQNKLDEFGITVEDCENNPQYQTDLGSEFSSGLAVVNNSTVVTQADTQEASIAPAPKKKGGRVAKSKEQQLEATQARKEAKTESLKLKLAAVMDEQIQETKDLAIAARDFTREIAEYQGDLILNMDSEIASQTVNYLDEAGETGRVRFGRIAKDAVDNALSQLV